MNTLDVATTIKATLRRLTQSALPKAEDVWVCQQLGQNVEAAAWRRAFEAEGTLKAQTLNFRTPQLNRLMVAQAVLVPDSVVEFCQWLAKSSTSEKEAMWAWLDAYVEGLNQPFRVHKWELIAAVLDKKLSEAMFALLVSKPVWGPAEVFCVQFERWSKAETAPHPSLAPVWQYRAQPKPDPSYAPFRKALQRANLPAPQRLVALIMQIEQGHVSPDVFEQAFPEATGRSNRVRYLGFEIVATKPTAWVGQKNVLGQALKLARDTFANPMSSLKNLLSFLIKKAFFLVLFSATSILIIVAITYLMILVRLLAPSRVSEFISRFDRLPGVTIIARLPLYVLPLSNITPAPNTVPIDSYREEEIEITLENIREIINILNSLGNGSDYTEDFLMYLNAVNTESNLNIEISKSDDINQILELGYVANNDSRQSINFAQDNLTRRLLFLAIYIFQQRNPQVRSESLPEDQEQFPNGRIVSISEGTGRYLMCAIAIEEGFADALNPPCPDDVGELR